MNIALRAMEEDGEIRHHKVHLKEEDQNKDSSSGKQSVTSDSVNLEDSWKTYLLSSMKNIATNSIKNIATNTYNGMGYVARNTGKAIFFGTVLTLEIFSCQAWTHCSCTCRYPNQTMFYYDAMVRPH